jgi:F1F0 ATPase subunit 2
MSELRLIDFDLLLPTLSAGTWLLAGMLIGALHFLTLRWNVQMFTAGRSLLPIIAVQVGRFAAVGGVLAIIASFFGALPLLAATAGILATRTAIIRLGVQL